MRGTKSETRILVNGRWHLIKVKGQLKKFCWFYDERTTENTPGCDDALIFRKGFATKGSALQWASNRGILSDEYEGNELYD